MIDPTHNPSSKERHEIGMICMWSAISLFVLFLILLQVRGLVRRMATEIENGRQRLAGYETAVEGKGLSDRIVAEQNRKLYLLKEWKRYSNLLDTWKTEDAAGKPEWSETARIDFKVALFDARERLARKAAEVGSRFPADLGISDSIGTKESISIRLLQLAAVQRLVEFALELRIPEIVKVETFPPEPLPATDGGAEYLDQYPIRLHVRCSMEDLQLFLDRVTRAQHFFTVSHLRADKSSRKEPNLLDVTVVFTALVLKEDTP